jgi:hypothetical protein
MYWFVFEIKEYRDHARLEVYTNNAVWKIGSIIYTGVQLSFLVTCTMNWAYKHGALLSKFSCCKTVVKYTFSSQSSN